MIRGLVLAGALVASLLPAAHAGPVSPFHNGVGIGGGVVDIGTGQTYDAADENDDGFGDEPVMVVPYRRGARIRVPLLLSVHEDAGPIVVTGIRLHAPDGSVVRPLGAVSAEGCCALTDPVPLTAVRLPDPRYGSTANVAVDVELCCATPPPGWVERLTGMHVTYRQHGLTRTVFHPFADLQTVVIRA